MAKNKGTWLKEASEAWKLNLPETTSVTDIKKAISKARAEAKKNPEETMSPALPVKKDPIVADKDANEYTIAKEEEDKKKAEAFADATKLRLESEKKESDKKAEEADKLKAEEIAKKQKELDDKAEEKAARKSFVVKCNDMSSLEIIACAALDLGNELKSQTKENIRKLKKGEKRKTIIQFSHEIVEKTVRQRYYGKLNKVKVILPAIPGSGEYPKVYTVFMGEECYLSADLSDRNTANGIKQVDVNFVSFIDACMSFGLS